MERWRDLILGGVVIIVATISPDKTLGLSIGFVLILLGICVLTTLSPQKQEV